MINLIKIKYNTIHTFVEQKKDEETEALLWWYSISDEYAEIDWI